MPTNMFRAFENVGDKESLMFVVLGGDDPGIITWVPEILKKAKETGMACLLYTSPSPRDRYGSRMPSSA